MNRHYTFAVLFIPWLTLFLLGCSHIQDSRKKATPTEALPDPVLKTEDDAKTIVSKAVKAHGGEKRFLSGVAGI